MNCNVILTKKEFSDLHNVLCELHWMIEKLEHAEIRIGTKMRAEHNKAREALRGAYEQDRLAYQKQSAHFEEIAEEIGAKTVWSVTEVEDMRTKHSWPGATMLMYHSVYVPIEGDTWVDLYKAADRIIRNCADSHHIFIEDFAPIADNTLELYTGS